MRNKLVPLWLGLLLATVGLPGARAWVSSSHESVWLPGTLLMDLKLGEARFNNSAQGAINTWNDQLGLLQLSSRLASGGQEDGKNDLYFAADYEGQDLGDGVLAATFTYTYRAFSEINQIFEADIVFNTDYTWELYSGRPFYDGANALIPDFFRVALHELGHVLGLGHPDENGQSVHALMNSFFSEVNTLTNDDITGGQNLYRAPGNTTPPGNDHFANATTISLSSGTMQVTGDNYYATKEAGEPDHDPGDGSGGQSVWWRWTAPGNGDVTLSTKNSTFDTLLGIYTGAAVNGLTAIAVNDDDDAHEPPDRHYRYSRVDFTATAGTTYYIAVDGWDTEQGRVKLMLSFIPSYVNSPPTITSQPFSQNIVIGQTAQFSVTVSGYPNPIYRWQRLPSGGGTWDDLASGGIYSGADTATLSVVAASFDASGDQFRCIATNNQGVAISSPATLTVMPQAPVFTWHPENQNGFVGSSVSFYANASGNPTPTLQWQKDGVDIPGATDNYYTRQILSEADAGVYRAVATNTGGSVFSNGAVLTIIEYPEFYLHPVSQAVVEGHSVTFTAASKGLPAPTYQWQKDGVDIPGANSASYTIGSVDVSHAGAYRVTATNWLKTVTSAEAILTILPPGPEIISLSPTRQVHEPGQSTTLSVTATGTGTIQYQWVHNGHDIPGAVGPSLSLTDLDYSDKGWYLVKLTDDKGTRRSAAIFVIVAPHQTQIRGWGYDVSVVTSIPPELTDAVDISAGWNFSAAALKRDGTVQAWGGGHADETGIPAGLNEVVAVSMGTSHGVALKSNGIVVAWGNNTASQLNIPPELIDVVAISTRDRHTLALKSDGTVTAWGSNTYGQTDVPMNLSNVVAIAVGAFHSLVLKSDGTVVAWGRNAYGESSVPAGLSGVKAISAGYNFSLAVKSDGTVVGWGYGGNGANTAPSELTTVVAVSGGQQHALALINDGTIVGWGANGSGETLPPAGGINSVLSVSAGIRYSLALRDLSGDTIPTITAHPVNQSLAELQPLTLTVAISGSGPFSYQWRKDGTNIPEATGSTFSIPSLVLSDAGSYDVVVSNHVGSATSDSAIVAVNTLPVLTNLSSPRQLLRPGQDLTLAVTATGTGALSYQWLHNGRPITGATSATLFRPSVTIADTGYYFLEVTDDHGTRRGLTYFVTVSPPHTQVIAWGRNDLGQTAIPTGVDAAVAIASGYFHSLILKADGSVVAFGRSEYGQVSVPDGLSNVVAVAAGGNQSMALKADGTVVTWGLSGSGVPEGLSNVVAIAGGFSHFLALRWDGTVVAWGSNSNGQTNVPEGLRDVVAIAAGKSHSLALKSDGTVVSWGDNSYGQTGGAALITGAIEIAGGDIFSIALKSDGTIAFWGQPYFFNQPTRHPPAGLDDVVAISATDNGSLALRQNGTVVAWGADTFYGGNVVPAGLGGIIAVARGSDHAIVLQDTDAPPVIINQPTSLSVEDGAIAQFSAGASGSPGYLWQRRVAGGSEWTALENNEIYSGVTTSLLSIVSATLDMSGDQFRLMATQDSEAIFSEAATLTVTVPLPVITDQPIDQLVSLNSQLNLTVVAASPVSLVYQWYRGTEELNGATTATLSIGPVQLSDAGEYSVVVSNSAGNVVSRVAVITIASPPIISTQPTNRTVYAGQSATFSVTATSNAPLSYQWQFEGEDIPGATASTYTIPSTELSHAGDYTVVVSTIAGAVTTSPATLNVMPATVPTITKHPEDSLTAFYGLTQFAVAATGAPAPTYRWQRSPAGTDSWQEISEQQPLTYAGVTSPTLLVLQSANVHANSGDRFRCVVSNLAGTAVSLPATLTVSDQAAVLHAYAGYTFSQFLRVDGSLWGMGRNNEGQLGKPLSGQPFEYAPATLATGGVLTAASGAEHSMHVTVERSLWGSGYNPYGALGIGTTDNRSTPALVASNVSAVTAGVYHTLFTKTDATLWGMGWNTNGQLGVGDTTNRLSPVQIADHVLTAAGGYVHSLFVRGDGSAWAMGHNGSGQFGNGTTTPALNPVQVATGVSRVATGYYHSLWLKTDGSLWSAGSNAQGQLGTGDNSARSTAVQIDTNVVQIAAALFHSLYLKTDGSLWGMGDNSRGQLGTGDTANRSAPVLIATDVVSVSAGLWHNLFTKVDGSLWGMGANDQGQLGTGDAADRNSPVLIASGAPSLPHSVTIVYASTSDDADRVALFWAASPGSSHYEVWRNTSNDRTTATLIAGRIIGNHFEDVTVAPGVTYHYWVDAVNPFGTRARTNSVTGRAGSEIISPPVITSLSPSRQVLVPGDGTTLSVTVADEVAVSYQWYFNGRTIAGATGASYPLANADYGQSGAYWVTAANAAGSIRSAPMFVLVAPAVTQLVPWGGNFYGAILPPSGVTDVIAIAAGDSHALGLKRDGTVLAWGDNAHGQTTVPAGLTGVVALAAGGNHSAVLKSDGTVVSWGAYYPGANEPVPAGLSPVTGLFTDGRGTLAVGIDGTVTGWNSSGAIANTLTNIAHAVMGGTYHAAIGTGGNLQIWGGTPIGPDNAPTDLTGYQSVDAESSNYIATKTDGTVVQWGRFYNGQANAPAGLTTVMAVAAAADHSLALNQDGTVVAWGGYNAYGQANVPTGLNQVFTIAAGGTHSLALRDAGMDTAPSIVTEPTGRTVTLGGEFTLSVVAEGTLVTYEWRQGGMTLWENSRRTGVRSATLHVTNAQLADAGGYTVTVRNSKGSVTSQIATVTVDKLTQTIDFPALDDRGYTQTVVNLSATASSGLPVTFAVVSGPATITGTQLRLTGLGAVTVRATQAGDLTYAPATPVDRSFIVTGNLLFWNEEQFTPTELADSSISGATADPDGDGLTNLLEYALDLNPKSVDTTGLPEMGTSATAWTFTYTRPADRPDLTYEVETSTNLVNWSTTGVTLTMTADHGTIQTWQASVPVESATNVFFRLKITHN